MKLWPWGLLLIGLIGVAAAATVIITLPQSGFVTVVAPGLTWLIAPDLSNVRVPLGGSSSPIPFKVQNSGTMDLILSCRTDIPSVNGISVSCPGLPTTALAAGSQLDGNIVFTASSSASANSLSFKFLLDGAA